MRNENGFGSIVCLDKSGKKRRKPWAVRITTGWKNGKQLYSLHSHDNIWNNPMFNML